MSRRALALFQVGLLLWCVLWIVLAVVTAHEVLALRDLSDTVVKTGHAVDTAGRALQSVAGIPFVGGRVSTLAEQVRAAGRSAVASGHSSRASATNLAILLGVAVGLIPTVPMLTLYLLLRSQRRGNSGLRN
jgi:hypothetical protein